MTFIRIYGGVAALAGSTTLVALVTYPDWLPAFSRGVLMVAVAFGRLMQPGSF